MKQIKLNIGKKILKSQVKSRKAIELARLSYLVDEMLADMKEVKQNATAIKFHRRSVVTSNQLNSSFSNLLAKIRSLQLQIDKLENRIERLGLGK